MEAFTTNKNKINAALVLSSLCRHIVLNYFLGGHQRHCGGVEIAPCDHGVNSWEVQSICIFIRTKDFLAFVFELTIPFSVFKHLFSEH